MILDRERFLAFTLALAACAKHGPSMPVAEGGYGGAYDDPECTGLAYTDEGAEICVAWRSGKVKAGWVPTAECARWNEGGQCTANLFQHR